jgi:hypothetical protein
VVGILLHKLYRKPDARRFSETYQQFISQKEIREKARAVRKHRGRKVMRPARGRVYDLTPVFERLNEEYFQNSVRISQLGWSQHKSRNTLGHFDPAHNSITLNRRLDHSMVPQYVVAFILYHEMLHAHIGERFRNGRRHVHHREFRIAEREFKHYVRAKKFIRRFLS